MSDFAKLVADAPTPSTSEGREERAFDLMAACEASSDRFIGVDSGCVLVVDPCSVPDEMLEYLTNRQFMEGVYAAVIVPTGSGDGIWAVDSTGDGIEMYRPKVKKS